MTMRTAAVITAAAALVGGSALLSTTPAVSDGSRSGRLHWEPHNTGTGEQYRGLDVVSRNVVWLAGEEGGVLRTTDGGKTWRDVAPRGTDGLAFRDVEATGRRHASVLSIGTGTDSRIYTTDDGGRTWTRAFVNHRPKAFYDCMAFWRGGRRGLALSDPVDGKFRVIATRDGGHSWRVLPRRGMPRAKDGEFAFAASGTCIVAAGRDDAWIGSGGGGSRVFHTRDGGRNWTVAPSRIPKAPAGGVFSLAFRDVRNGVAVGGDFTKPRQSEHTTSRTRTSGSRWIRGGDVHGYRSGVDWVGDRRGVLVAVGPTGSDITRDAGRSWHRFSRKSYDAIACTGSGVCFASGPDGRVGRLRF